MHDPTAAQMNTIMSMENVSMMGGVLLISQLGSELFSLDNRKQR